MQPVKNFLRYVHSFSRRTKIIAGVALLVLIVVLLHLGKGGAPADPASSVAHVTLASVASLSNAGGPLPVVGNVTSVSQASISALSGGEITSLPRTLGDRVSAGQVIASFENSSQQAAVLQAQGTYDAAVASKVSVSPVDVRTSAINAYRSAFNTLDTTLEADVDLFFGGRTPYGPLLLLDESRDNRYGKISQQREALDEEMEVYRAKLSQAETGEPVQLLDYASALTQRVIDMLNDLSVAANRPEANATAAQLAGLSSARSDMAALRASLASEKESYRAGSVTTTSSTDASITIALGGLRAAQAALEKTYVRAPISGTIVSLPVHRGDFVSAGTLVAIISNPGSLQVESYVTSADAKTLSIGGKATIDGGIPGTVVFIAPALDPTTGKIQVKVSPTGGQGTLVDGSTVTMTLERAGSKTAVSSKLSIPIAAAKMTPQGPVVFTVASSTLVSHPISFGAIQGGQVEVVEGLDLSMDIVVDARGLSEGQVVVVDSQ